MLKLVFLLSMFPLFAQAQLSESLTKAKNILYGILENKTVKPDSALKELNAAHNLIKSDNSDSALYYRSRILTELAYCEYSLSNYNKSIADALESLQLAEMLQDDNLIFGASYRLGANYAKLGSKISELTDSLEKERYLIKSKEYFKRTHQTGLKLNDSSKIFSAQTGLINTYLSGQQNDSVLLLANNLLKEISPANHKERSQLYNLCGIASFESKKFQKAGEYFRQAIAAAELVTGSLTLNSAMGNLANVYMEQKNYPAAKKLLYQLINSNISQKRKQALSKNYITLHNLYKRQAVYDSALFYFEKYYQYRDSVLGDDHKLQIQELEVKYETERKESQIKELSLSNALKTSDIKRKNLWISLLLISGLVISGGIFLYNRQKALKQKQEHAELKQQLITAQMNPHFLFNALNSIQRLYVDGRVEEGNLFMSEFAQFVRDILDKTGRVKIPLAEEVDFLTAYLTLEKKRLGNKFDFKILIDEELKNSLDEVPSLISQPLAENALAHGVLPKNSPGVIDIQIRKVKEGMVSFIITDNGIGYEPTLQRKKLSGYNSKGLELIKGRLGSKGKLTMETLKDSHGTALGTKATLWVSI